MSFQPMIGPSGLGYRTEEVLSYLTGLAPVGTTFEFPLRDALADLGFGCKVTWYRHLNALISKRRIRRVHGGAGGSTGVLMVIRRLEGGQS